MSAKIIFVLCVPAFFIQTAFSQCTSRAAIDASGFASPYECAGPSLASAMAYDRMAAPGLAYDGLVPNRAGRGPACNGFYTPAMEFTATSGGGLPVTSMSSISPTGISVMSKNAYEGALSMIGELPFVGAVAMEGRLPTAGAGAIDYGCGNGVIAMLSEGIAPAAYAPNAAMASGAFGPIGAYGPTGAYGPGAAFGANAAFGLGPNAGLGLGNGFGPAAGFAPANRFGYGGCGCGMVY